jgi:hypothetical protein
MAGYDEDGSDSKWVIAGLKAQIADLEDSLVEVIRHHGYIGDISPKASSIVAMALHKVNARSPQEE